LSTSTSASSDDGVSVAEPDGENDGDGEEIIPDTIDARLNRGRYTIIALAATPPLSISHVSRVLRGISRPSLDVAQRLADAAGISLTDLLGFLRERQESPLVALKGKRPRGPSAKFNHDTAREIRARIAEGDTVEELAEEYNCSRQAMNEIARGVSYPSS
jgi:transcriptional regulator with XRE-family HTH domain